MEEVRKVIPIIQGYLNNKWESHLLICVIHIDIVLIHSLNYLPYGQADNNQRINTNHQIAVSVLYLIASFTCV
jgi:hypothetical protein